MEGAGQGWGSWAVAGRGNGWRMGRGGEAAEGGEGAGGAGTGAEAAWPQQMQWEGTAGKTSRALPAPGTFQRTVETEGGHHGARTRRSSAWEKEKGT